MKNKLSLLILLSFGSSLTMAKGLNEIERTQRMLELRQKQEYINQQLEYPNRNEDIEEEDNILELDDTKKYLFTNIQLVGPNILKSKTDKVIEEYRNTEMSKSDIYELLRKLSNIYLVDGYVTTLVTIKSGNVNTGELIYEVKEGKLRDIKYLDREASFRDRMRLKTAFPMRKGDLLNNKDMDQGIENMNIGGYNNIAEITPTEEYGYSDIYIEENYQTTGFSIGMDDSGYKDKGRNKVNINFSQDNILGMNDNLTLNYIERLTKDRDADKESNYDIRYSFPIGYWKFMYSYNLGDNYNTATSGITGNYKTESKSEKQNIKISRILSRGQYSKTTLHTGFEYKDNYNSLNGAKLEVSSKSYANVNIALDHTNRFLGGTLFGMIEYERGVPWLGAEGDPENLEGQYKIEYDKINLNLDWMRIFSISKHTFQYRMGIGGSYSEDRLLAAEQFTMGDEYTVRGFKESSVAGNKGIYVNNTITYLGTQDMNSFLARFKPFIGLDGGISRDLDLPSTDKIIGMALGVRFNMGPLNASFTYGIPLKWAEGMPHEANPVYFNVSYNF